MEQLREALQLANEARYSELTQQADAVAARLLVFCCSWVSIYYAQKAARPPFMFGKHFSRLRQWLSRILSVTRPSLTDSMIRKRSSTYFLKKKDKVFAFIFWIVQGPMMTLH
jgi:hypothetical protein